MVSLPSPHSGNSRTGLQSRFAFKTAVQHKVKVCLKPIIFAATVFTGIAFGCLGIATPATAFELFGYTFFGGEEETDATVPDPLPYEVQIAIVPDNPDLLKSLENVSVLVSKQSQPPSGEAGLVSRALADRDRLIARMYASGFYGGTLTIRLSGILLETALETGNIPDVRPAKVDVAVETGPTFVFGVVSIDTGSITAGSLSTDPAFWGLAAGETAGSSKILTAENRIVQMLRGRGYPDAKIAERIIVADHASSKLDVRLVVAPGHQARFGAVTVAGTEVTDPDFVARQASIPEGEIYSPQDLEKARKRLNDLGIFSSIRFVEGDVAGPDGTLPIIIEVSERKRHVIGAGASWSSTEGFGVEAYWRRRNLFGRGELLSVEGSVGRIGDASPDEMEYSARIAFEKPGVFGPQTKFTTSLGARQESPDAYTSRSVTLDAYLQREYTEQLKGRVGAELFYADEEDAFGDGEYFLIGLPADLTYDTRDDKLNPSKGVFAALAGEPAYDTLAGNTMAFLKGTASSYVALDKAKRFILAGRVSAGSIVGPSVQGIPASRRFIAGGGGSIRGYGYRNVGPRVNGEIVGGRSLFQVSGEVRLKVTETVGLVGFVDAGNAYEASLPDFSTPLKIGVGVGVRYFTPIGPLRVDAAIPLDPEKDDPDFALYVGLSQAF